MILVIGSIEEYHSRHIVEKLQAHKAAVCYFDTRHLPTLLPFSWNASNKVAEGHFTIEGQKISFQDIQSIYWRWHYGISVSIKDNKTENAAYTSTMVTREIVSAIDSIFCTLDHCLWINSLHAINMHKNKPHQLNVMAKHGIRVPKSLITNDKEAFQSFYEQQDKKIIYKPVRGGAHTSLISEQDFSKKRLESLLYSPVQFQEFIEGIDIRVYAFTNGYICAAEILAGTVDFRDNPQAEIRPCDLPDVVKEDCFKILKLLDLQFSGIDIRRTPNNEYVFIEANPSPMFTYFEDKTGFHISDNLVKMLMRC